MVPDNTAPPLPLRPARVKGVDLIGSHGTELLTVPDVMRRLQVSRHMVYQLIRSRRLGSVKIGRCRRIPATALAAYLSSLAGGV